MRNHDSQSPEESIREHTGSQLKLNSDRLYLPNLENESTSSCQADPNRHSYDIRENFGTRYMPYGTNRKYYSIPNVLGTNASDSSQSLFIPGLRARVFSAGSIATRDQALPFTQNSILRHKVENDYTFNSNNLVERQHTHSTPVPMDSSTEFFPIFQGDLGCEYEKVSAQNSLYEPSGYPHLVNQFPRFPGDLYIPFWTRGMGKAKEGLCRLCPPETWLKIKISAYWYHVRDFTESKLVE
jgi:Domain of unknown function (DUF4451)